MGFTESGQALQPLLEGTVALQIVVAASGLQVAQLGQDFKLLLGERKGQLHSPAFPQEGGPLHACIPPKNTGTLRCFSKLMYPFCKKKREGDYSREVPAGASCVSAKLGAWEGAAF